MLSEHRCADYEIYVYKHYGEYQTHPTEKDLDKIDDKFSGLNG